MIKRMDRVCLCIIMEHGIKENGRMISRMEQAQKHGLMDHVIQVGI